MWKSFEVPWQVIPDYMKTECEAGKRSLQTKTSIIHIVVDYMRKLKPGYQ